MQAHMLLKGPIYTKVSHWHMFPGDVRTEIKEHCIGALNTQDQVLHLVARSVADMLCVELRVGYCLDIIDIFLVYFREKIH